MSSRLRRKLVGTIYQDGLLESVLGVLLIGQGSLFLWQRRSANDTLDMLLLLWSLAGLVLLPLLVRSTVRTLKARISVPRMGYVRISPAQGQRLRLVLAIAVLLTGLLSGLALFRNAFEQIFTMLQSSAIAVPFVVLGRRFEVRRYLLLAALIWLQGVVWLAIAWPAIERVHANFVSIGGTLVLVGAVTLWRFRRNHPLDDEV